MNKEEEAVEHIIQETINMMSTLHPDMEWKAIAGPVVDGEVSVTCYGFPKDKVDG